MQAMRKNISFWPIGEYELDFKIFIPKTAGVSKRWILLNFNPNIK